MPSDETDFGTSQETSRRIVLTVFVFCGLFASLEFKLFSLVGLNKAARVPPAAEVVMLIALIFILPLIAAAISGILEIIANRAAAAAMRQDHGKEVAVAVMMLRHEVKRSLVGKSALLTVSFLSVMLWLTGAANQGALMVCLFASLCLAASIADNVLLARKLTNGRFPETEADARVLLRYICNSKESGSDGFGGRPILPNDVALSGDMRVEGVRGLSR